MCESFKYFGLLLKELWQKKKFNFVKNSFSVNCTFFTKFLVFDRNFQNIENLKKQARKLSCE